MKRVLLIGYATYLGNIKAAIESLGHEIVAELTPAMARSPQSAGFFEEAEFIAIVVGKPMLWWRVCPEKHRGNALVVDINYAAQEAGTSAASAAGFIRVAPFPTTVEDATTTIEGALETLAAQS